MSTPLYNTDIIPLTSRPTLTVMDDGDYFVILDTSTGKISKILKTLAMEALKIGYDNTTSGLTAETVQAALDELVVNLGATDLALANLAGTGRTTETVKANADDIISIKGTGYTEGSLKTHEDRLDTLEGTGEGSVAKAIADAVSPLQEEVDTNRLYSDSQYLELKAKADAMIFIGKNLFNKNDPDCVFGQYYDASNVLTTLATVNQSGFIPINGGQEYTSSSKHINVNFYDINKAFISSVGSQAFASAGYVTAPSTAKFARFGCFLANWELFQVEAGRVVTIFEPFQEYIDSSNYKLKDSTVSPLQTNFIKIGKNLFNKDDPYALIGKYYDKLNVLTTNANYNQSGFIPVTVGGNYTASVKHTNVNFYAENKAFISGVGSQDFLAAGYVTVPEGAAYARFGCLATSWELFQVEAGQVATSYEPYRLSIDETHVAKYLSLGWNDKKWVSFGDSITAQGLWQPYVASKLGMVHTNCGIGSTKVAGEVNVTYPCFWEPPRISAVQAADPDVVTILGGANDWGGDILIGTDAQFDLALASKDKTTFKGAYSYIIETLLTWKPALRIFLLTTTWGNDETPKATTGLTYRDYAKATQEIAWYYGIPCIDTRGEMGVNRVTTDTLLADNIHPNAAGAKRLAEVVIGVMKRFNPIA